MMPEQIEARVEDLLEECRVACRDVMVMSGTKQLARWLCGELARIETLYADLESRLSGQSNG
jgi:hypothetical protein